MVIAGGHVIDPATKLVAVRYVGIINSRIAQISEAPLQGKEIINSGVLLVAPGFIDLHVHGRTNVEQDYQLHDGITTALELERGIENIKQWHATHQSKALINYGASVCWPFEGFKAIGKYKESIARLSQKSAKEESNLETIMTAMLPAAAEQLTDAEMAATLQNISTSLVVGGIGIGVPIGFLPKTNPTEMYKVFQLAGEKKALVYTHVREADIISIQEVINNAVITNAAHHMERWC
jgi:dihydroorotase